MESATVIYEWPFLFSKLTLTKSWTTVRCNKCSIFRNTLKWRQKKPWQAPQHAACPVRNSKTAWKKRVRKCPNEAAFVAELINCPGQSSHYWEQRFRLKTSILTNILFVKLFFFFLLFFGFQVSVTFVVLLKFSMTSTGHSCRHFMTLLKIASH